MVRTGEPEMISSCDEDREEDRCMQVPIAEAIGIQEIEPVPLWEVYLLKSMKMRRLMIRTMD